MKSFIRLTVYADTIVTERDGRDQILCALRFGGYPEVVRAMSDAIYGGATVEASVDHGLRLIAKPKGYHRKLEHDGVYATATLMANDDELSAEDKDDEEEDDEPTAAQPRKSYIFCPVGDRKRLFEELDHKTSAPLIPEFQDYVLDELIARGDLHQLSVLSLRKEMDAWALRLLPEDRNVVQVLEEGLQSGKITIPGSMPSLSDGFDDVNSVTDYLNAFGVTVADRIRSQFQPLFDPATEPLSEEILAINDYIQEKAGYPLYDAQLAFRQGAYLEQIITIFAEIYSRIFEGKYQLFSVKKVSLTFLLDEHTTISRI